MGHTSGTDEMLQSGQTLAEARARVSALLADPKVQKQIDTLAEKLTTKGRLTGDEVRAHLKGKKAGVSVLSGD
jgi:ribose 1,5-bisphosphokinase PhnN